MDFGEQAVIRDLSFDVQHGPTKENRVTEMILTTLNPTTLVVGKVISLFLVGLLLIGGFIPFYIVTLVVSDPQAVIVQIFTYFPMSAPVTAMLRNAFGSLNPVESTIVITELFVLGFISLRVAVQLFRYGSIEYSRKLTLRTAFGRRTAPGVRPPLATPPPTPPPATPATTNDAGARAKDPLKDRS